MADSRRTLVIAAILIMTATALGAFGTHALKPVLPAARFDSFESAVTYQFFHSLGLLAMFFRALSLGLGLPVKFR